MKKNVFLISGILLFIVAIVGTVGCQKENLNPTKMNKANSVVEGVTMLTPEQIEFIGDKHNEYLERVFIDVDFESNNLEMEFLSKFENLAQTENIAIDVYGQEVSLEENLQRLEDNLSENAYSIINQAIVLSYNIENFSSFESKIKSLEDTAKTEITSVEDLNIVLVTLCVLRKSAYFWLSSEQGGSGVGAEVIDKIEIYHKGPGWLAADGAAAGGGMIGVAVSAALATGPVGWGVFAGVAVGSGIASGWYALTN